MTKTLKRTLLFMLAAVMLMAGTLTAYAEDGVENPYIETIRGASVMGSSPVIFRDTSTGMPAYCIDYNRGIPDPESLSGEFDPMTIFDPDTYKGLEYLLLAGYPFNTGGLSNTEAQACTQLAVWCWTGETLGYGLNANNYSATNGRDDIYEYFIGLMEAARNQTPPDIGIDCGDIDMVIDGDYLTGSTTVTVRNLDSYAISESVLPDGITVSGYTGGDGDVIVFTATLDYAGESITIDGLFTGQDTRSALNLFWYDNSNSNQQRMVISYYDETTTAVATGISLYCEELPEPEYGYITLIKTATDTDAYLSGAVFGVFDSVTDEKLGELTTGEDGTATLELPIGEVYLVEQTAPEGYLLSTDRIDITILGDETVAVTATNEAIPPAVGVIRLIKTATDTDLYLSDAVFGVYDAVTDEKLGELTTGEDGTATLELPIGEVYLVEQTAPEGYLLSTDRISATVLGSETVTVTAVNEPIPTPDPDSTDGKIKLIKKDADNGKLLGGAIFGVYRAADNVKVCEIETNTQGEAQTPLLSAGDYYLKELSAPDGYECSSEKVGVTVKAGQTVEITITNEKTAEPDPDPTDGRIKLIKKDADSGKLLDDAVFGVYRASDDVKVCELETTSKGEAVSPLLPVGDYYLKELTAPDGYERSSEKVGVTVKADQTVEITITNEKTAEPDPDPTDGKIKLIKKDADSGKLLGGAIFGVYRASDDVKVCELETTSKGEAVSLLLPAGDYYLKELTAPKNYERSTEKYGITVKADKTVEITITNPRTTETTQEDDPFGELLLIKKAEGNGARLPGAVFGVYRTSDNKKLDEVRTDSDGTASLQLEPGDYYLVELTAPTGFVLESTRIPFTVKDGKTVEVEVTNQRDDTVIDAPDIPLAPIELPKTGETLPVMNYALAALCMGVAVLCGVKLRKNSTRTA